VLCFAAALCLSERRRKLSAGLEEKDGGGENLRRRKGRADRIASTPPSRVAHQKKLMATYTVETFKCHFLSSKEEKRTTQLAPLFLTFFFFLTHRSNSKRLTGTPTSQPSGKIKSTRNLFREGS
jgi:hypothetical protein